MVLPDASTARPLQDRFVGLRLNTDSQDPLLSYLKALISPVRRPTIIVLE